MEAAHEIQPRGAISETASSHRRPTTTHHALGLLPLADANEIEGRAQEERDACRARIDAAQLVRASRRGGRRGEGVVREHGNQGRGDAGDGREVLRALGGAARMADVGFATRRARNGDTPCEYGFPGVREHIVLPLGVLVACSPFSARTRSDPRAAVSAMAVRARDTHAQPRSGSGVCCGPGSGGEARTGGVCYLGDIH